jgi:hypothetical protein
MKKLITHNNTQYEVRWERTSFTDYISIYEITYTKLLNIKKYKLIYRDEEDSLFVTAHRNDPDYRIEQIKAIFSRLEAQENLKSFRKTTKDNQEQALSNWDGIL